MGQNNFILFGFLFPAPKEDNPIVLVQEIPHAKAFIKTGPAYAGEVHPVLLTGKAANIAFEWFKKQPKGFHALAEGGLKTFNSVTRPVVHYLDVYELDNRENDSI